MTNDEEVRRIGKCAECGCAFDLQGGLPVQTHADDPPTELKEGDKEICFPCWLSSGKRTGYEV
jgi:hypothetical protein